MVRYMNRMRPQKVDVSSVKDPYNAKHRALIELPAQQDWLPKLAENALAKFFTIQLRNTVC